MYANNDPVRDFDPTDLICSSDEDNCDGDGGGDNRPEGSSGGVPTGSKHIPLDPPSNFVECNPRGNPVIERKLNFIYDHFPDALDAANNFEQGVTKPAVTADAIAIMFLQWSINEAGYPGTSPQVTAENNWFGFQKGGVGAWGGLEIQCPQGDPIPGNSTNACFSQGTNWNQELAAALGAVSPNTGTTYGQALETAINAGVSTAARLLHSIADNGWNGSATYGLCITSTISIKPQIDCLEKNGYIP